jgi:hypothetical protein
MTTFCFGVYHSQFVNGPEPGLEYIWGYLPPSSTSSPRWSSSRSFKCQRDLHTDNKYKKIKRLASGHGPIVRWHIGGPVQQCLLERTMGSSYVYHYNARRVTTDRMSALRDDSDRCIGRGDALSTNNLLHWQPNLSCADWWQLRWTMGDIPSRTAWWPLWWQQDNSGIDFKMTATHIRSRITMTVTT